MTTRCRSSGFPSRDSFAILEKIGARYAVFHLDLMGADARASLVARLENDYLELPAAAGEGRRRVAVRNHRLAALAFFVVMAVLHSWPLASDPAHLGRLDNDDAALNTWVIAWVAHVLPRDPLHMFDAPIFFPEPHTLAYSEHLFVPALMGAPLWWLGASPVLEHNLLLIAGLALSGWAMALVIARWTGSLPAGVIAGLIYAFNAHVLTRLAHLQAQHVEFFPVMLYAVRSRARRGHQAQRGAAGRCVCPAGAVQRLLAGVCGLRAGRRRDGARPGVVAAARRAGPHCPPRRRCDQRRGRRAVSLALLRGQPRPGARAERERGRRGIRPAGATTSRPAAGSITRCWSHNFFAHHTALFPGVTALALCGARHHQG